MATYDCELTLISESIVTDELRNQKTIPTEKTILCSRKSITRSEFYGAASTEFKPEIVFIIHGYEYDGQQMVKFEGKRYKVIRTYGNDFEEIELTCERVRD